jgi:hypothetical protein
MMLKGDMSFTDHGYVRDQPQTSKKRKINYFETACLAEGP